MTKQSGKTLNQWRSHGGPVGAHPPKLFSSLVPTLNFMHLRLSRECHCVDFAGYSIALYTECSVVTRVINHNGFFGCCFRGCATPKTNTEEEERRKRIYFGLFSYHLPSEVKEARGYLANLEDLSDVIVGLLDVEKAFPELLELLAITLTFGVSTASCERSFSCLNKTLKTYLWAEGGAAE